MGAASELDDTGTAQLGLGGDLKQRETQAVEGMGRISYLDGRRTDNRASILSSLLWSL